MTNNYNGMLTFSCDYCETETEEYYKDEFFGALADIKADGWIIKKKDGEWLHFCDDDCKRGYKLKFSTKKKSSLRNKNGQT